VSDAISVARWSRRLRSCVSRRSSSSLGFGGSVVEVAYWEYVEKSVSV
jgi:hypothetical protein